MSDPNKRTLVGSQAGMRLIAFMTIYNRGDFSRLRSYIVENYHPPLLEEQAPAVRVALLKAQYRMLGKLRVVQVLAVDKHEVIVLAGAEKREGLMLVDTGVEPEYPHLLNRLVFQVL